VWIAIAGLAVLVVFLTLAVLGAMREVVVLRGDVKAFRDLVQRPPAPSFVGGRLPSLMSKMLPRVHSGSPHGRRLVVFLSPGCQPCQDLADGLSVAIAQGAVRAEDLTPVVWSFTPEEANRYASGLPFDSIPDGDGKLARACEVRATPTLFIVSEGAHEVLDYSPEGSVQWVIDRLAPQPVASV